MAALGWVLLCAKRELGQMPDKAPDFLVAGCWEKPLLGTEGLQWHGLKRADNLGQLSGSLGRER